MQYMLMCCFDETAWNELPAAQKDRIMRDYGDWVQNLADAGASAAEQNFIRRRRRRPCA